MKDLTSRQECFFFYGKRQKVRAFLRKFRNQILTVDVFEPRWALLRYESRKNDD